MLGSCLKMLGLVRTNFASLSLASYSALALSVMLDVPSLVTVVFCVMALKPLTGGGSKYAPNILSRSSEIMQLLPTYLLKAS